MYGVRRCCCHGLTGAGRTGCLQGRRCCAVLWSDGERQPERDIRERKARRWRIVSRQDGMPRLRVSRPEKYGTWGG